MFVASAYLPAAFSPRATAAAAEQDSPWVHERNQAPDYQHSGTEPPPEEATTFPPTLRKGAAMAYDPVSERTVLFGGQFPDPVLAEFNVTDETWTWDGRVWSKQAPPGPSPPARTGAAMAYDEPTGKLVLFGGTGAGRNALNDTWTWDGTMWTQENPQTSPPGGALIDGERLRPTGAVGQHPVSGRALLLRQKCGYGACDPEGDAAWAWDGVKKTWDRHSLSTAPPGMLVAAGPEILILEPPNVVDGYVESPGDTWSWDGTGWTEHVTTTPYSVIAVTYHTPTKSVVLLSAPPFPVSTWTWDGKVWRARNPSTPPPHRVHGAR